MIDFAHAHNVVVVQDAAHSLLSYASEPFSFLQVDGAKEVGVEVHSMSKGYNMIGWRLGFVCGNARIVQAYADVKDNSDSGNSRPFSTPPRSHGTDNPQQCGPSTGGGGARRSHKSASPALCSGTYPPCRPEGPATAHSPPPEASQCLITAEHLVSPGTTPNATYLLSHLHREGRARGRVDERNGSG